MPTVKQIETAKPKEKPYRLLDDNNLYLYVPVSGKKVWQLRCKIDGRERILTVGRYPLMTLREARDKVWTAREDISVGTGPVRAKKASSSNNSFSVIYREWCEHKKQVWSVGYVTKPAKMLDDDILPIIGGFEIQDIEPMQLLGVVRRFEDHDAMGRANKAHGRCGEVFRYAIVTGRAGCSPAPDLADAIKGYRKKNFPSLLADQIPAFNKALAAFSGGIVSLVATRVLRYTTLRMKELRSMRWKNVGFKNRAITINANVMKGRKIHAVPMSDQVVEFPTILGSITKPVSEFVLAGRDDKKEPICENAVLLVIRQIGYEGLESGHGFRHEFSTIMNGHRWPANATEMRLAHTNGGSVRGIYNHAQYLDKRRKMMQWWADWFDREME